LEEIQIKAKSSTTTLERPQSSAGVVLSHTKSRGVTQEETMPETSAASGYDADVVVIGGGPGGYVAAIRAAQLGARTVLVEKNKLGGTCLNVGCIPTKVLLHSVEVLEMAKNAASFGVQAENVKPDIARMMKRKDDIVKRLVTGVGFLMKKNGIEVIEAEGKLLKDRVVQAGDRTIRAKNVILALGSVIAHVNIPGLEEYLTSDDCLAMAEIPESMVVIGAGAVGMEFAYMYHKLGTKVTVVEMMPQILPNIDSECAAQLHRSLSKDGMRIYTSAQVQSARRADGAWELEVSTEKGPQKVTAQKVLMAVGRIPATDGAGLEEVGVKLSKRAIVVDDHMRTSVPGVYAVGDVVGGLQLAHKASEEGKVAAENCCGLDVKMDYRFIPGAVYTNPEIATVGLTEEQARESGYDVRVGRFSFQALGKALAIGSREGMVKVVVDAKYGEILGVHMVGPHVTDLISEAVVAMKAEATVEELGRAVHPHPTLPEAIMEAALDAMGQAIHS
jgi:dihydrolipoamide dehydrogenase